MNADQTQPSGSDLTKGIEAELLADGAMLLGQVGEDQVILARSGDAVFAIDATCTHYGGPLAEGLLVGDTVRCPWHHACFSVRTGEAVRAPALNPVACWSVEPIDGKYLVRGRREVPSRTKRRSSASAPASIVILGGEAAAEAALETLRQEGYREPVTVLSADSAAPYDRPNLSKDFLAGTASEEWLPLRDSLQIDGSVEARDCRVTFQSAAGHSPWRPLAAISTACVLSWDWRPQGPFHDAPFEL